MKYKIGDVSKILKLSDQMIRYYEKAGIIHPERKGDGNYRYYSAMDVFWIYEAMKYKEWNITLQEVKGLFYDDFFNQMIYKTDVYIHSLDLKIKRENLLLERIKEINKRLIVCKYNEHNFWVELIPSKYIYLAYKAKSEDYDLTYMNDKMAEYILGPETISFFDPYVIINENGEEWNYSIDEMYHDGLEINDYGTFKKIDSQLCMTTIVDMGNVGSFDYKCTQKLEEKVRENGYTLKSDIFGILIGRGKNKGEFIRKIQLFAPIETL